MRELVLSDAGPMLADVYTAGGEVLMGTLRWEKEGEEKAKTMQRRADFDHKRAELQAAEADTRVRIKALQLDLERQRAELAMYSSQNEARIVSSSDREHELRRIRSADPAARAATGIVPALAKRRASAGSGNSGKKIKKDAHDAP